MKCPLEWELRIWGMQVPEGSLDVGVLFVGDPAELLHGPLLFRFGVVPPERLSFFLAEKLTLGSLWPWGVRVAIFYELPCTFADAGVISGYLRGSSVI
jgi:hypothetical protein